MQVMIGNCPCSWGVWHPDGSPGNVPYEVFLQEVAQSGTKHIELGPVGYLPQDVGLLRDKLDRYGIDLCAGTICTPFEAWDRFEDYIPTLKIQMEILKAFGAGYLVAMDASDVGLCSSRKATWTRADYDGCFEKVRALDRYTREEYGVMTVFHPHAKQVIETQQEIDWLMEATEVNLCVDSGHHAYVNGDLQMHDQSVMEVIRKYSDRVKYLHFKNVDLAVLRRVRSEHMDMHDAMAIDVMCDLDKGMVDFGELKAVLEEIGFEGYGVIEQDMVGKPAGYALEKSIHNQKFLEGLFGAEATA